MALAIGLVPLLCTVGPASAHPLGNFTVNRYAGVHLTPGNARVDYVLDMAEIPTFQEMTSIDVDADGAASDGELARWAAAQAATIGGMLQLTVSGHAVPLSTESARASLVPGQGGLDTLRLEVTMTGPTQAGSGTVEFVDRTDDDRVGWNEVVLSGEEGLEITDSSVPSVSASNELRAYPNDLLSSPLDVRSARATFEPGVSGSAELGSGAETVTTERPGVESAPLARVLANHGVPLVVLGLLVAFAVGAWHALLPGHGKTLMAAAMVGSGARSRQAAGIAAAVALMHTASVLALGMAVLALERRFRPEVLYPWLGVASGLAALAVGGFLLRARWRAWRGRRAHAQMDASTDALALSHRYGDARPRDHEHSHDHGRPRDHEHSHDHGHDLVPDVPIDPNVLTRRGVTALAFAGGVLPAPSALLVMLGAIQAHRVVYGLSLVAAFSVGLAMTLLAVGLGALRARDAVSRRLSERAAFLVPVLSACAILLAGAVLTVRAASQV